MTCLLLSCVVRLAMRSSAWGLHDLDKGGSTGCQQVYFFHVAEYTYTAQLCQLVQGAHVGQVQLPPEACGVHTPLDVEAWKELLRDHPDKWFASFIVKGVEQGFRIGFQGNQRGLQSAKRNMWSASEHPDIVSDYLENEVSLNKIARIGHPERASELKIHCSPFGVIPKRNQVNKWRLILDLSSPEGKSVNDGIPKELVSLTYMSVDDVVYEVVRRGKGTLLAKMDVQQAYRNIPVHPQDRHLLGMLWQEKVFVDLVLPFGLRSAPLLFSAAADALQWVAERNGVSWVKHYINDFVTLGSPGSPECANNMATVKKVFAKANLPLDPAKEEGPSTCVGVLGVELDTVKLEIRLPADKLARLKVSLETWKGRRACKKRELLSLIGSLSHACKAVRAGRSFLRRLIDLSCTAKQLNHFVRLGAPARSDIMWWHQFCTAWNGVSMLFVANKNNPEGDISIVSDASGSWGSGAIFGQDWFQLQWAGLGAIGSQNITIKELLPIVVAAALWGSQWAGKTIQAQCDNIAVVAMVNARSCCETEAMHLLRCLAFLEAKYSFLLWASHIPGAQNTLADALSRDKQSLFHSLYPQANQEPVAIPAALLDVLVITKPDWTSLAWTQLWSTFSSTA